MAIPVLENIKMTDERGYLTPEWRNILQALFDMLQVNFSEEGLIMPSQTADDITTIAPITNGTMIYDSTNKLAKIVIDGALKTITTS